MMNQSTNPSPEATSAKATLSATLDQLIARIDKDSLRDLVGLLPIPVSGEETSPAAKYLVVTVGSSPYAIPLANLVEVLRMPTVTPLPSVPRWLRGVMNLRGEIVSVVDLRHLLNLPSGSPAVDPRLVVLRSESDEIVIGFVVDEIIGLRGLDPAELKPCSEREAGPFARYLSGWFERDNQLLPVFHVDHLLRDPELRQFDSATSGRFTDHNV